MGQKVDVIDLSDHSIHRDGLNPFDIAKMLGEDLIALARSIIAGMIEQPETTKRDFFWID